MRCHDSVARDAVKRRAWPPRDSARQANTSPPQLPGVSTRLCGVRTLTSSKRLEMTTLREALAPRRIG